MCQKKVSYADDLTKFKLFSGLVNSEIKEDILGADDKSLEDTVKAIEAEESAKRAKGKLGVATWSSPQLILSREACESLGLIKNHFPAIGSSADINNLSYSGGVEGGHRLYSEGI